MHAGKDQCQARHGQAYPNAIKLVHKLMMAALRPNKMCFKVADEGRFLLTEDQLDALLCKAAGWESEDDVEYIYDPEKGLLNASPHKPLPKPQETSTHATLVDSNLMTK